MSKRKPAGPGTPEQIARSKRRPLSDPPTRSDGRCHRPSCGKPRPPIALEHDDPFCSAVCSRVHYGVLTMAEAEAERREQE